MSTKDPSKLLSAQLSLSEKQKLVEYYDTVPLLHSVDYHLVTKHTKKIERNLILKALSAGKLDPEFNKTRHALSVNEIILILKNNFEFETAKSNLYYHVKKLAEIGLITKVRTITVGNISTNYYGKTSKLIWYKDFEKIEDHSHFTDDSLSILIQRMDKNQTIESIGDIKRKLSTLDRYYHNEFMSWVQENEKYLKGFEINFLHELSDLFNKINYYTVELTEVFSLLARSLRIKLPTD